MVGGTVNYLSHFLLAEKLLPLLNKSPRAVILQVSSSFHWAVGEQDLHCEDDEAPIASFPGGSPSWLWRGQRTYANSKLAQILHARALARDETVHARTVSICPGWVATNVAGKAGTMSNTLLHLGGWSAEEWGISSALTALFSKGENGYVVNSQAVATAGKWFKWCSHPVMTVLRIRDALGYAFAGTIYFLQQFLPSVVVAKSSPESYNEKLQDSLYAWSKDAVKEWL